MTDEKRNLRYLYGLIGKESGPNPMIVIGKSSSQNLTTTEATLILGETRFVNGNKLTRSGNGVLIGSGVSYVEVSGQMYINAGLTTGDTITLSAVVDSGGTTSKISSLNTKCAGTIFGIALSPTMFSVSEGDIIYLQACNGTSARGTVPSYPTMTFLTVKVIAADALQAIAPALTVPLDIQELYKPLIAPRSVSLTGFVEGSYLRYGKFYDDLRVFVKVSKTTAMSGTTAIGTLPAGYRPTEAQTLTAYNTDGNVVSGITVTIGTDGAVAVVGDVDANVIVMASYKSS